MDQQKEKTNSNKVKFTVKRKSKFTNRSSKVNDKKRNRLMHDNFGEDENKPLKKFHKKKKKKKCVISSRKKKIFKKTE